MKVFLTSPMSLESGAVVVGEATLGSPQARVALAFLVIERRRAVPRDELAEVVWPGTLPSSWQGALRGLLSKVRAALAAVGLSPAEVLTSAFGCYQLHLPPATMVDVEAAASSVAAAESALRAGDAGAAIDHALAARVLAARALLPAQEGEWVERVRAELRATLLQALDVLSEAHARRRETGAVVAAAEEAIALEPFRESAHRRLMAAYAAAGSRGEALRAYERCRRLLGEELGVKPSAETEAAYVALLGDEPAPEGATRRPSLRPALPEAPPGLGVVGRDDERHQLAQAWERARAGRRQLALVAGEAGMGKTSLALEVASAVVASGGVTLYGRCDREVWAPYQPFAEALGRYAAACPPDELCRRAGWGAAELARLVPELSMCLPAPRATAPSEDHGDRHRLFSAVVSFLAAASAAQPMSLVIDDLHWAGPGAVLLLRHLVRALDRAPLLVVATYRLDEVEGNQVLVDTLADLGREPGVSRLELGGLEPAAVIELARRAGGEESAVDAVALWEETGGNPFFLTEVLAHAARQRPAGHAHRRDQPRSVTTAAGVPPRVGDAIAHRRSRLSPDADRVLEVAAVIGLHVEVAVLEQVAGLGADAVLDALDEAAAARLLAETNVGRYRFVEPLVRDVVYHQLGATRRARLHAAVGQALEHLGAGNAPDDVFALAHHFAAAGALGPAGKDLDYTVRAGNVALAQLAYERAAGFYQRGLGLGLDEASQAGRRCEVLMALAEAWRKAGQVGAARETYLEAIRLARALDDPEALATCALGLGGGGRGVSAWIADEVRVSLLEEALAALGPGRAELRAKVESELAKALYFSGQHDRADALAQEAVALAAPTGDRTALAAAVSATRVLRWGPGNTELRLAYAEDLVGLGQAVGDAEVVVRARLGRLADLVEMGERAAADADVAEAASLADRLAQPYYRWRAGAWSATLALVDGRLNEAERASREALAVWGDEAHPDASAWASVHHAVAALTEGRAKEATGPVRTLSAAYPMVPAYRCLLALAHAAAGETGEARAEFERFAADGFTRPPLDTQWLFGVAVLAETCALLDDTARAGTLFELLVPFAGRLAVLDAFGGGGAFWGPVSHQLGLLAATLGRAEEAQRRFAEAGAMARRVGAARWVARAREGRSHSPSMAFT